MKSARVHVLVDGRVQGVCFRMDTRHEAFKRNLTGWVKNLRDGRVEAVFEGEEKDVKSMLRWCEAGPPRARVNKVDLTWEKPTGEFSGFEIVF